MKTIFVLFSVCALTAGARDLTPLTSALRSVGKYHSGVRFEVLLPSSADPVAYDISLDSEPAAADTLSPCNYLIEWNMPGAESYSTGFAAYFGGHHYRYRGDRVQEYHTQWDAMPFAPGGRVSEGVQRTAQFADLLPAMLADKLDAMAGDSTFIYTYTPDTLVSGQRVSMLKGVQTVRGLDGLEYEYTFDHATHLPLRIELLSNPGSISEQAMSVVYANGGGSRGVPADEDALIALYPDVFERFRSSNFRIENLVGQPLPGFSAPTVSGERYTRERGAAMRVPTIVAVLDPAQGDPAEIVSMLREASASLPFDTDIIWAFISSGADEIEQCLGYEARMGEHALMSARALARDAGVTAYPTVLLTDVSGVVTDVIIGFNKDLASDVIQKMALAN